MRKPGREFPHLTPSCANCETKITPFVLSVFGHQTFLRGPCSSALRAYKKLGLQNSLCPATMQGRTLNNHQTLPKNTLQ